MPSFTGGCYCGAVRYRVSHKPLAMFKCHCRSCQKVSGGPYTPVVLIASRSFKLTQGNLRHHFTETIKGERHKRGFCGDCGSRITGAEGESARAWMAVTASSLDDPTMFKPAFDIFTSHAQLWDLMDPNLPKHETYQPR